MVDQDDDPDSGHPLSAGVAPDGYRLLSVLGSGGFSTVFLAHEDRFDRDVALKILNTGSEDPRAIRRFANECMALGRLGFHSSIADVYAAGTTPAGQPFIAMPHYRGGSLGDELVRSGPLGLARLCYVGVKMASALAAAHEQGILHRDVKPQNILLSERGEPFLSDFGVALLEQQSGTRSATQAFSYDHVAPEVLETEQYGPAADQYALASTLYTLATGEIPFTCAAIPRKIVEILYRPPPPITDPDLAAIAPVLARGMSKSPQERYPTVGEFGAAIRAAASGQEAGDVAHAATSKHAAGEGVAEGVAAFNAGPPVGRDTGSRSGTGAPDREDDARSGGDPGQVRRLRRRKPVVIAAVAAALVIALAVAGLFVSSRHAPEFSMITTGWGTSCSVTAPGTAYCWGNNEYGQLGDGTTDSAPTPVEVVGVPESTAAISRFDETTCAIATGGDVFCWGLGLYGQLGGEVDESSSPVKINGLGGPATAISVGNGSVCALVAGGQVYCWGSKFGGELGDGTTKRRSTPVKVKGMPAPATAISVGSSSSCAVLTSGQVYCWGGVTCRYGNDGKAACPPAPPGIQELPQPAKAISVGFDRWCAVSKSGDLYCTGVGFLKPAKVGGLPAPVIAVSGPAGEGVVCIIVSGGDAYCRGPNEFGALGNGDTDAHDAMVKVNGLPAPATTISTGGLTTCATVEGGDAYCWGRNNNGQLGDGTMKNSSTPVKVQL